MKTLPLILVLFFALAISQTACQEEAVESPDLQETIANDPTYAKYRITIEQIGYYVATKRYDPNEILEVLDEYPTLTSICELPAAAFEEIKGGLLSRDIHCKLEGLNRQLNNKFGFSEMSLDDRIAIKDLYYEKHEPQFKPSLEEIRGDTSIQKN